MEKVKKKLNDEVSKNRNYAKIKTVVDEFITGTLDRIVSGATEAAKGATGDIAIGNAVKNEAAEPADFNSVNSIVKGIKEIVDLVLKDKGDFNATKTKHNEHKTIGKLLSTTASDGTESVAAARASIGAVSGADILKAIASSDDVANNDVGIDKAKNAAEIAAAKKESKDFGDTLKDKDAVIAAGIALRAMAKGGKFAANNDDKSEYAVNAVTASAIGKTLSTLIIGIRDTVDSGLKKIKEELGKVREEDRLEEVGNPAEATARASVKEK